VQVTDAPPQVRRVAMLSIHSSPAAPPGGGDSGGMNVYIRSVAHELAALGVATDLYTRADGPDLPAVVELEPGVRLLHLRAGPQGGVPKNDLHGYLAAFLCSLAHAGDEHGPYDLVHSHYWLSGWVARVVSQRWRVPFVHSFHTLGKVKNAATAGSESPEPHWRLVGEERVTAAADRLVVPTPVEGRQLVELYGAAPGKIELVEPGVDTDTFRPGDRRAAREAVGARARHLLVYAGRLQPLKGPDVAVRTVAELRRHRPDLDVELLVVGGPSGPAASAPGALAKLARAEGVGDRVRFLPPQPQDRLAVILRAADLLLVPSRSESFGLIALEAQACGTPVVATRVGGLRHAVGDGTTGVLVPTRDPAAWAGTVAGLLDNRRRLRAMRRAAERFSRGHGWDVTAAKLLCVYQELTVGADCHGGRVLESTS
jgi:D-inositol-3-phosphate glycosyltransferase